MEFRGDERAVTVQIGAVLLLAIVFAALALYQLNAVPAENERVEFSHNQAVHDELQELRNAVQNVGTDGGTESTAVTLGTQYPSRTVAANPPAPTGRLETTGTANISIDARFAGDESDYDGNPHNLTENDHTTTTIAYTPSYREYDSAPTTRIEHGFAFNDFDDAQVSLTDQPLLSDGTIRLVALEGELSRSGSGAVTIDPTALGGPSDPVPIEGDGGENVTITIPTAAPTAWNDTIGTTFDDGESNARVADYDATGEERGSLTIELTDGEYDLQVARVGIDGSGDSSAEFGVRKATSEEADRTDQSGRYETRWEDSNPTEVTADESVTLTMEAVDNGTAINGAHVTYAVRDPDSVVSGFDNTGATNETGRNATTLELNSPAVSSNGSTVTVYVSSGGVTDRVRFRVTRANDDPDQDGLSWTITDDTARNVVQYAVSYDVSAASFDHARIEFTNDASETTMVRDRSDSRGTVEYSEDDAGGDPYTITITAFDASGDEIETETRTDTADGTNPGENDDMTSPEGPRLDASRVDDWSQPNDRTARYFVSYDVTHRDAFERVEVSFKNRNSGAITTETATSPRGRLEFSGNRIGDEFEIELRVYDTDGILVDSRTVDDTADGTNPAGNGDLSGETSPQFESVSVTNTGNNGQSRYSVEYDVSRSTDLGTVWAEFRNLDNAWASETVDRQDAIGQFTHEPGGGTGGDAYEITLFAFDSDGAVVDRWYDGNPG